MVESQRNRVSWGLAAVSAAIAIGLAGCSSGESEDAGSKLVIATTNFSETKILAAMYEEILDAKGFDASIKELTTREVIAPALSAGQVQITPEYLGSFATYLNAQANGAEAEPIATGDVAATLAAAEPLADAKGITLLEPSAAQDQNAFAVTAKFAADNALTTLSDLGAFSAGSPITLGGPPECPQRPFCQPGLEETYGVEVGKFSALDAGGPLTIAALKQATIEVGLVFSSSGSVTANDLVLLEDDKNLQTAENIVPAVHTASLTPAIEEALNSVSAVLTTADLQRLNAQVEIDRMDPDDVAEAFLQEKGLL